MNDYFAVIHGIPAAVLGVAVDQNYGPIHKYAQVVARGTEYFNLCLLAQARADISLPADIMQLNLMRSVSRHFPEPRVKFFRGNAAGIQLYCLIILFQVDILDHFSLLPC